MTIECRTQAELDRALAQRAASKSRELIALIGDGWFRVQGSSRVVARGSSHVVAWGSSHVVAWGSSHVEARESSHVVAWESSHVVAWGSSHVVAWGSSHVEAWGSSHVEAWGSSHVVAAPYVGVHRHGSTPKVKGGVLIQVPKITTAQEWLDYHGLKAKRGVVVLFKAVDDDWHSAHKTPTGEYVAYAPGAKPEAPDWDGGKAECGGGFHFAFHPVAAKGFFREATRYVGCPVKVAEIVVHPDAAHPDKIKAPRVVAPGCFEVDAHGDPK